MTTGLSGYKMILSELAEMSEELDAIGHELYTLRLQQYRSRMHNTTFVLGVDSISRHYKFDPRTGEPINLAYIEELDRYHNIHRTLTPYFLRLGLLVPELSDSDETGKVTLNLDIHPSKVDIAGYQFIGNSFVRYRKGEPLNMVIPTGIQFPSDWLTIGHESFGHAFQQMNNLKKYWEEEPQNISNGSDLLEEGWAMTTKEIVASYLNEALKLQRAGVDLLGTFSLQRVGADVLGIFSAELQAQPKEYRLGFELFKKIGAKYGFEGQIDAALRFHTDKDLLQYVSSL